MPHVNVKLYPGRSDEDKAELARAIAKNVTTILNAATNPCRLQSRMCLRAIGS